MNGHAKDSPPPLPPRPMQQHTMVPTQQYPMAPVQQYPVAPMHQYPMMPMQQYSMVPMQQYPIAPMQQYSTAPVQQYPAVPMQNYSTPHGYLPAAPPPYGAPPSLEIELFTTPVSTLKAIGLNKPIDIVAHWTLCINGWCYELARQDVKNEKYYYRTITLEEWKEKRTQQRKTWCSDRVGQMARPYTHELIHEVGECTHANYVLGIWF